MLGSNSSLRAVTPGLLLASGLLFLSHRDSSISPQSREPVTPPRSLPYARSPGRLLDLSPSRCPILDDRGARAREPLRPHRPALGKGEAAAMRRRALCLTNDAPCWTSPWPRADASTLPRPTAPFRMYVPRPWLGGRTGRQVVGRPAEQAGPPLQHRRIA